MRVSDCGRAPDLWLRAVSLSPYPYLALLPLPPPSLSIYIDSRTTAQHSLQLAPFLRRDSRPH